MNMTEEYNRFDDLEEMRNYFSDSELLDEVIRAMSTDDVQEIFEYIRRMHSIDDD